MRSDLSPRFRRFCRHRRRHHHPAIIAAVSRSLPSCRCQLGDDRRAQLASDEKSALVTTQLAAAAVAAPTRIASNRRSRRCNEIKTQKDSQISSDNRAASNEIRLDARKCGRVGCAQRAARAAEAAKMGVCAFREHVVCCARARYTR